MAVGDAAGQSDSGDDNFDPAKDPDGQEESSEDTLNSSDQGAEDPLGGEEGLVSRPRPSTKSTRKRNAMEATANEDEEAIIGGKIARVPIGTADWKGASAQYVPPCSEAVELQPPPFHATEHPDFQQLYEEDPFMDTGPLSPYCAQPPTGAAGFKLPSPGRLQGATSRIVIHAGFWGSLVT